MQDSTLDPNFLDLPVTITLPGPNGDFCVEYKNGDWSQVDETGSPQYRRLLLEYEELKRENKVLRKQTDKAAKKIAILTLELERLQAARTVEVVEYSSSKPK